MAFALVFIKPRSAIVGVCKFHPPPPASFSSPILSPKTPYCFLVTADDLVLLHVLASILFVVLTVTARLKWWGIRVLLMENTCKCGLRSKVARIKPWSAFCVRIRIFYFACMKTGKNCSCALISCNRSKSRSAA